MGITVFLNKFALRTNRTLVIQCCLGSSFIAIIIIVSDKELYI